ncbi:MAG: nucleic acid-binding protein [Actinomycetota bacterium]|nr:nucleic acid-binding protein [Actinomycetota bacterium]MDQ3351019.1 nucleic acid-binding protein [Actinomycetota bacterium]
MLIVLDSGPLGLLSNPATEGIPRIAREWAVSRVRGGDRLCVPEIADYEVRRELLRAGRARGVERLDGLCGNLPYAPLTTATMRSAAALWAKARNEGVPTAHDEALDGDVILAAQVMALRDDPEPVVVATTNVRHIARYVEATHWRDI